MPTNFVTLQVGKFYKTRDRSGIYKVVEEAASSVSTDRNTYRAELVGNVAQVPPIPENFPYINRWSDGSSNRHHENPKDLVEDMGDRWTSASLMTGMIPGVLEVPPTPAPNRDLFFIVYSPGGPTPPRTRHSTFELADAEAQRMARAHPNQAFFAMKPLSKHQATTSITSERYD